MQMKDMIGRLSQLQYLKGEIDDLSQRIAELELAAQGGAGRVTGMPRGGRKADRIAECAVKIADLRDKMDDRRMDCMEELARLYDFIDDIPDSLTRQIFSLRYIDGLSWQQVAFGIGESDEQFPRRVHNRYLRKLDENDERKVI